MHSKLVVHGSEHQCVAGWRFAASAALEGFCSSSEDTVNGTHELDAKEYNSARQCGQRASGKELGRLQVFQRTGRIGPDLSPDTADDEIKDIVKDSQALLSCEPKAQAVWDAMQQQMEGTYLATLRIVTGKLRTFYDTKI